MFTDLLDGTGTATPSVDNGDGTGTIANLFDYSDGAGFTPVHFTVAPGNIDVDFGDGTGYTPDNVDMLDGTGGTLGGLTITRTLRSFTVGGRAPARLTVAHL